MRIKQGIKGTDKEINGEMYKLRTGAVREREIL